MSYGTLGGALAYHAEVGNALWEDSSYTDTERSAALLRASRVLDGRWGRAFSGVKATADQREAWPRIGAYDLCADAPIPEGTTPVGVVEAAYELALVELVSPRSLSPTVNVGRLTKSEGVDGAANRSFFTPAELAGFGFDPIHNMRPVLTMVVDLLSCFVTTGTTHWAAVVV